MDSKRSNGGRREAMGGLAKGLAVLRAFGRSAATLSLSEVASRTSLPPATARRCLLTLEELGYVGRVERRFMLRPKVLELGAAYLDSVNVDAAVTARLRGFALDCGDSAALSVLDGDEVVYIAHASARTLVRLEAQVGSRFPAHATSMGQVLLAALGAPDLQEYLMTARLVALTEHTLTTELALRQRIALVRRQGYAVVSDELDYGVVALAVAVRGHGGRVVAAVNCSSHSSKVHKRELVRERLPALQALGRALGADLGRFDGAAFVATLPG